MSLGIAAVASGVGAGAGFTSPPQPRRIMGVWWDYGEECWAGVGWEAKVEGYGGVSNPWAS